MAKRNEPNRIERVDCGTDAVESLAHSAQSGQSVFDELKELRATNARLEQRCGELEATVNTLNMGRAHDVSMQGTAMQKIATLEAQLAAQIAGHQSTAKELSDTRAQLKEATEGRFDVGTIREWQASLLKPTEPRLRDDYEQWALAGLQAIASERGKGGV